MDSVWISLLKASASVASFLEMHNCIVLVLTLFIIRIIKHVPWSNIGNYEQYDAIKLMVKDIIRFKVGDL